MKRGWKIALISLGSLIGLSLLAVAVVLWLVFTPSQLTKIVNRVAAEYVTCETTFESVDLTLFKTFPDVGLKVENVCVVNPTEGARSDTLAMIGSLTLGLDLKQFLKENKVTLHQLVVENVDANFYIGSDGSSNFDIFPSTDEDSTESNFSLDSLPEMDLRKVKIGDMNATLVDEKDSIDATLSGVDLTVKGTLKEGMVDADVDLLVNSGKWNMNGGDMTGHIDDLKVEVKAEGNLNEVAGKVNLELEKGALKIGETEMVNNRLQESSKELLKLQLPYRVDLEDGQLSVNDGRLQIDDYALMLDGLVKLASNEEPMKVDVKLHNSFAPWQVEPLLGIVPDEYMDWKRGMDLDGKVAIAATVTGDLGAETMPLIRASATIEGGRFHYPKAVPYKVKGINADLEAVLDLNKDGVSTATVNSLKASTRGTNITLTGNVDDLLGDMLINANLKANLPLEDVMPMVPDSMNIAADGKADIDLDARLRLSDLDPLALEKTTVGGTIKLKQLDVTYDSIHAVSPSMDIALQIPAQEHSGKMCDVHLVSGKLKVASGSFTAEVENPDINVGLNDITREQVAAAFDIRIGEAEANIDSTMVSMEGLKLKGSARLDSTQQNIIRQYNPNVDIDLHGAVLYMPTLPDAVRLSQLAFVYKPDVCNIKSVAVKLGHSDFSLYGDVENIEGWIDHRKVLKGDLNFTSSYADVDQLISLISGLGSDADSLEQMRQDDDVPAEANPFIVPKDVDVTLHTHIKRSVAFGNDLNDVAGAVTINDGVAVLDQIGFVCKAATMQLTALYKSPRPSHLFVSLDFHLLDILVDELIDMIPTIDTLVPMLSAFEGNANFHLAAETYLNANYEPLMSSLKGAAAISGKDLTVLDNNTIAQIAKFMQFKSWKDKDNKIRIDSLDVELTCLNKVIEVYPFLLNIGKYSICASGMHSLDNQCGYHLELLKNPILARIGVDVKGDLSSPKISLGQVRYADYYRPDRQGVVEKQTLELKRMVKQALEAKVR